MVGEIVFIVWFISFSKIIIAWDIHLTNLSFLLQFWHAINQILTILDFVFITFPYEVVGHFWALIYRLLVFVLFLTLEK